MEELCRSIGHQNATILTSRSAGLAQFPAPVALSCQQPYAQRAKNQEDTRKRRDISDDGEKSVKASDYKASDYKASDYKASDYKASDYKASDYKASDYKASDYKASDYKASDYKASDYKASDYKANNDLREHGSVDGSFTDDGEMSVRTKDCEEHAEGRKHESVGGSFTEELSAYIPKDSILMRSIRDRKPEGLLFNERYTVGCKIHDLEGGVLQDMLESSKFSTGGALIIQDINQHWAEMLRSEFPGSARTTFLAEHMVRLDAESVTEANLRQLGKEIGSVCPKARMKVKDFSDECLAVDFGFPFRLPKHEGMHIDFLFDTVGLERVPSDYSFLDGTRQTVYEKGASNRWRRASHRMSWCKLAEQFYLVLIESSPGFEHELSPAALKEDPYQIMLESRIDAFDFWTQPRLPIQCAGWEGPNNCVRSMTAQLLRYHSVQSVFAPVAVPLNETLGTLRPQRDGVESTFALKAEINVSDYSHQLNPTRGERQIIVWLMMESSWQLAISTLERNWQRLRYRVTKQAGGESFMMLTGLRRQVADAQNFIAESKSIFTRTIRETRTWAINGRLINADEFWSSRSGAPTTAVFRHAQSMDIRNLPDTFEKMEEKIVNMTRAINQEIQVVIGSVQVEDAKTMKRQTEWMVVLALLAAIYLPMTLVTGIFGMNISEINADETLPSRWAALKAWGVVFGATLGCLVVYAMVRHAIRWLLEQRELAKAEAMHVEALKLK